MKNTFLLLALSILTFTVKAQPAPEKIQKDGLQIGRASTLLPKELIFDSGDGVSNKKLSLDPSDNEFDLNSSLNIQGNLDVTGTANIDGATILQDSLSVESVSTHKDGIVLGEGINADKTITLDKGGSNPYLKWDSVKQKWVFSNDSVIEKAIGSGAGGAGAISVLENGGFEDGINSGWEFTSGTVTALTPPNALYQEASAQFDPSAQNDYLRSVYFTVPKILRGNACEMRFFYTGGDALNYSAKVETESGVTLGVFNSGSGTNVLPVHTSFGGYESVFFKCPTEADITTLSTNGNIRLVIYQGTANNAAAMTVDDFHLGGLIGLTETTTPDVCSGRVHSATVTISATPAGCITSVTRSAASGMSGSVYTLNHSEFASGTMNCTYIPIWLSNADRNIISAPFAGYQEVRVHQYGVGNVATTDFNFICQRAGSEAKQSVQVYKSIPKVFDNLNTIAVSFNTGTGGTAPALDNNGDQIGVATSIIRASTGRYIFQYSGSFSRPICSSSTGHNLKISTPDASSVQVEVSNSSLANVDVQTFIDCTLQKKSSKMPTVQPIIIGQVTNSAAESGLTNVRIEACTFSNNGTASIDNNSGLCSGWVNSVSRTSAGRLNIALKSGVFSERPVCTGVVYNNELQFTGTVSATSLTSIVTLTANNVGTATDTNLQVICIGKR